MKITAGRWPHLKYFVTLPTVNQNKSVTITTVGMKHYRHGTCLWQRLATAVVAALCAHAACASTLAERIDSIIGDKR